eukprot:CAMPEP_0119299954 /NCGR_PEP_ID=MMETSP1333-20130426/1970_1 /TAXON_ID=418940 /ORGANISM="Scyphosphaera apsteinii, Strain RCC1455" /LENGTH=49 /DNA_ID=CAMNT_0007301563 /DNA_START=158 /DNA_END=307 /DNA_ORIENTATION=+
MKLADSWPLVAVTWDEHVQTNNRQPDHPNGMLNIRTSRPASQQAEHTHA